MRRMAMALAGALALLEGAAMAKMDDGADVGASTNTVVLQERIKELEKEVARLNSQIKTQRYGLVWLDVPEAFEKESENAIPILEEDKSKAIRNDDGKPTHILIEGDNYHALTCLNYTHRGKIDVIYIDPPYNTGNGDFIYKDKRKLDKYPNGEPIKPDSPLRHSTWLSFMEKRLKLAMSLLSDRGVIFISIDDNEQAQLKLLCDKIFGEGNFVAVMPRLTKRAGKTTNAVAINHDYVVCYGKTNKIQIRTLPFQDAKYKYVDEFESERGKYALSQTLDYDTLGYVHSLDYPIIMGRKTYYPGGVSEKVFLERKRECPKNGFRWRWSKELFDFGLANGFVVLKKGKNGSRIYTKTYERATIERENGLYKVVVSDKGKNASTLDLMDNEFSNDNARKDLDKIFADKAFDYAKPESLIERLVFLSTSNVSTVLDFFAGSGTTMHAVMKLNAEDGGKRQCILVNNNENGICEKVTYERNRRVIQGYRDPKGRDVPGLGNSLKYYRTAFVGENEAAKASDEDREALSRKAGCLLGLAENTLEETASGRCWQVFTDGKDRMTGVYFSGDAREMEDFVSRLEEFRDASRLNRVAAYFFCWDDASSFANEFRSTKRIDVKPIPEPILKVYKELNK